MRLSILKKISIIVVISLLSLILVTSITYYFSNDIKKDVEDINTTLIETNTLSKENNFILQNINQNLIQAVSFQDDYFLEEAELNYVRLNENIERIEKISKLSFDQDIINKYYTFSRDLAMDIINENIDWSLMQEYAEKRDGLFDDSVSLLEIMDAEYERLLDERLSNIEEISQLNVFYLILFAVIFSFVVFVVGFYIANGISKNARSITKELRILASGEGSLSSRLNNNSKDEFGDLSQYFNQFVGNLEESFNKMQSIIINLNETSVGLDSGLKTLKEDGNTQSDNNNILNQSIEEMNISVNEVSKSINSNTESSNKVSQMSKDGLEVNKRLKSETENVKREIIETSDFIKQLAQETKNVTEILNSIQGIADQTNLLALNAAIEAARAGDAGRGFAVVADEVRSLSSRTANSVNDIEKTLNGLVDKVSVAVNNMSSVVKKVELNTELNEESFTIFNTIVEKIQDIDDQNNQIASATEEQSFVLNQVIENSNKSNQANENSKGTIEKIESMSSGLSQLSDSLLEISKSFK